MYRKTRTNGRVDPAPTDFGKNGTLVHRRKNCFSSRTFSAQWKSFQHRKPIIFHYASGFCRTKKSRFSLRPRSFWAKIPSAHYASGFRQTSEPPLPRRGGVYPPASKESAQLSRRFSPAGFFVCGTGTSLLKRCSSVPLPNVPQNPHKRAG